MGPKPPEIAPAEGAVEGYDNLVRFFANGNLAITIRLKDVATVLCPSENPSSEQRARLDLGSNEFAEVPTERFKPIPQAIMGY